MWFEATTAFLDRPGEPPLAAETEVRGLELALQRWDGEVVYLRENVRAVRDPGGEILYYEGTLDDITALRKAETALRERKQFLRTILAYIPAGVYWEDRDSVYIGCNDDEGHGLAPGRFVVLSVADTGCSTCPSTPTTRSSGTGYRTTR